MSTSFDDMIGNTYKPSTIGSFGSSTKGAYTYMPQDSMSANKGSYDFNSDFKKSTAGGEFGFAGDKGSNKSTGSGFGVMDGVQIASAVGNLWLGYQGYKAAKEQNALARDAFEFNKDLSTKNFNIAKEDRDRRIKRSDNISSQYEQANQDAARRERDRQDRIGGE